jgi:peptide subunit release factor 1 (eRF1)
MISREQVRELAQFHSQSRHECAISFYFQPRTPQNKSHREESILAKDLVRNALRESEKSGRNGCARADLQRILKLAENLQGNQARAKAVFACAAKDFWREYDLPPLLTASQVAVNQGFHLKPLAMLLATLPKLGIVLFDRQHARVFDYWFENFTERVNFFQPLSKRGRSDGYAGYDAGHSERRLNEEVMHHFKRIAQYVKDEFDAGRWENWLAGCLDINWTEFEPLLPAQSKQRFMGHFSAEVASAGTEQVRQQAQRLLQGALEERRRQAISAVLSYAKSHKRGVTGLRRVLRSLEMGEVRTLVLDEGFASHAVECTSCGHLDAHIVAFCALCGHATRELDDVCEAIVPRAIQRDIELLYVKGDPDLDRVGNIAALLRFRSGERKGGRLAQAS